MRNVFFILAMIAMVAVLLSLIGGLIAMAGGGEFNKKYGNKLMRARVGLQAAAIVFLLLAFLAE